MENNNWNPVISLCKACTSKKISCEEYFEEITVTVKHEKVTKCSQFTFSHGDTDIWT